MVAIKDGESNSWTFDIEYDSSIYGYSSPNSEKNEGRLRQGDNLEIFFFASFDNSSETRMKGPSFKIRMPQSRVAKGLQKATIHTFYPFFLTNEGL